MKTLITFTLFLSSLLIAPVTGACSDKPKLETVPFVDLNRYLGKWYEIARFEQRFQEGCVASTATYTLRDDGKIGVLNQCHMNTVDGKLKSADGYAKVVDKKTNAKLKVTFFWPFFGKYWVIDLGENYEYAVVGHPNRKYLWILSRTPQLDQATFDGILERLRAQHYDLDKLIIPPQK
jgi:apolipoprotein D and lipocalin family protein